jgi:hypothetical protein
MLDSESLFDKKGVEALLESVRKQEDLTVPEMLRREEAGEPYDPADLKVSLATQESVKNS